uniref:Uncharacterized protein n=1 Tax=Oryza glumipatula TaxID=40148 RepID=A0A0E0ATC1_9ORYZ
MGHIYPSFFPYRPCLPRRGIAWRRALHVARSSLPLPHPHAARSPRLPLSPTACFLPLSPAPLHQTLRPSPSLRLPTRHLPVASSAAPSGAAVSATERPRFLERCGLNADEFDDDAEAEPMVGLFGRSIRGLAEVNFTAVSGGLSVFLREEEGKAIVMAGSGLSLRSGSGNVLPFVLASPSSSQKIPHCWLHR